MRESLELQVIKLDTQEEHLAWINLIRRKVIKLQKSDKTNCNVSKSLPKPKTVTWNILQMS